MMAISTNGVTIVLSREPELLREVTRIDDRLTLLSWCCMTLVILWILAFIAVLLSHLKKNDVPITVLEPNDLREHEPYIRSYAEKHTAILGKFMNRGIRRD